LTVEPTSGRRNQSLTEFGELVYTNDRYIEELGTLYLLQYQLAKQKLEVTAWYFFFNEFNMSEFTKEEFVREIQNYIMMSDEEGTVAIRSLNNDFSCIINTYLPRYKSHHIILKGASGNGKTYIACALGNAACRKFKTVRYIRMPELLDELHIAKGYKMTVHMAYYGRNIHRPAYALNSNICSRQSCIHSVSSLCIVQKVGANFFNFTRLSHT